jgi:hypothetical protein
MKTTILLLLAATFVFSCHENIESAATTPACGVPDPANQLEWLRTEIESLTVQPTPAYMDYIAYAATYKGDQVIYIMICCPTCNTIPPLVRDCRGTVLGQLGIEIAADALRDTKIIWRTTGGPCS